MFSLYQSVLQNASWLFCSGFVFSFFWFRLSAEDKQNSESDEHDWYADDGAGEVLDCQIHAANIVSLTGSSPPSRR